MSGMEAATAIQLVGTCIDITAAIISVGRAAKDAHGLPPKLKGVLEQVPTVEELLKSARRNLEAGDVTDSASENANPALRRCEKALERLKEVFQDVAPEDGDNRGKRFWRSAKTVLSSQGRRVQELLNAILEDLKFLEQQEIFAIGDKLDGLSKVAEELGQEETSKYANHGAGNINVNEGGGRQTINSLSTNYGRVINNPGSYHEGITNNYYELVRLPETPPPPLVFVPFRRDPDYVPRAAIMEKIHEKLSVPEARVALVGLGGVGKTMLTIEYCHWTKEQTPDIWILWIHVSSYSRFAENVSHLVEQLKIAGRDEQGKNPLALLEAWLRDGRRKWLLVLDNADDHKILHQPPSTSEALVEDQSTGKYQRRCIDHFPICNHGSILFTSRDKSAMSNFVDDVGIIIVPPMEEEHAVTLLKNKVPGSVEVQPDDAAKLVRTLEYMPLAVAQAGAYIRERAPRCSIQQYLQMLQMNEKSCLTLLRRSWANSRRDQEASNSIILTWQISFEQIHQDRPSAIDLLALMSFCDGRSIPESLLRAGEREQIPERHAQRQASVASSYDRTVAQNWRKFLTGFKNFGHKKVSGSKKADLGIPETSDISSSSVSQDVALEDDLMILEGYSFISRTTDGSAFEVHSLVQLSTRTWLEAQGNDQLAKSRFVETLTLAFPMSTYENWTECQNLLSHAQAAAALEMPSGRPSRQWATLMYHASSYAREQGMLTVAKEMSDSCHRVRVQELGEMHSDTINSVANLALTYQSQGKLVQAEELGVKVLKANRGRLGELHQTTVATKSHLAVTYQMQGQWFRAEELGEEIVKAKQKTLGAAHPSTIAAMHNLVSTYTHVGKRDEAEALMLEVIETSKKVLGEAHLGTLTSMSNLAVMYMQRGEWSKAERLGIEVLETQKKALGEANPKTLTTMANCVSAYFNQGRLGEAEKLGSRAVDLSREVLGDVHPNTLTRMANLAQVYGRQGRVDEAESLERAASKRLAPGIQSTG